MTHSGNLPEGGRGASPDQAPGAGTGKAGGSLATLMGREKHEARAPLWAGPRWAAPGPQQKELSGWRDKRHWSIHTT